MRIQQVTTLPVALKEWRRVRSMSQATLAKEAHVSEGLIAQIETGRRQPGLTNLLAIARALEVNANALAIIHGDYSAVDADYDASIVAQTTDVGDAA